MAVEGKNLIVPAVVVGKTKMLKLPLEQAQLTGQWKLKKTILELQARLCAKESEFVAELTTKEQMVIELAQQLQQQIELAKEKESENLKLANRIRHLENTMDDLINDKAKSQNNQQESKLTE